MLQYIKLAWKHWINIIFYKDQTNGPRTTAHEKKPIPKVNPNTNPNPTWGAIFIWGNCPDTQTNAPKQIRLKVAAESNSYFLKIFSEPDHNWSKQVKNRWRNYEVLIFTSNLRNTYSVKHLLVAASILR